MLDSEELGVTANSVCVLVVDDAGAVRGAAKWMLEHEGFEVLVAESGALAIELFHSLADHIHAVLLDYRLPDIEARTVADAIRRRKPPTAVVYCSAYGRDELDLHASEHFIQKPFQMNRLAECIRGAIAPSA